MTRFSARYAVHIAVLTALALVPVLIHSYAEVRVDDCAHPEALIPAGYAELAPEARRKLMASAFAADEWREGTIRIDAAGRTLSYSIIRSWDPKRLYYRPEYRMIPEIKPKEHHLETLDVDGEPVPLHRAEYGGRTAVSPRPVALYVLMYEGEAVANPYWAQISAAPRQMLGGSRPMTLFLVWGGVAGDQVDEAERRAREWLVESVRGYRSVCGS